MKLKPYSKSGLPLWATMSLQDAFDWMPSFVNNNLTGDTVRFNNTSDQFTVEIDLPGVMKNDINLEIIERNVYITARRTIVSNGGTKEETITRSFVIDGDADTESIDASLEHGVLTLRAKRKSNKKGDARRININ